MSGPTDRPVADDSRPEQDAADAEGEGVEKDLGERDGAHGGGGVGEAADHHGVDDAHAHPADLGEDEGEREAQHGAEFGA